MQTLSPSDRETDGRNTLEVRLCINCLHFREELEDPIGRVELDMCVHPSNGRDLLRGDPIALPCANQRVSNRYAADRTLCGINAGHFEPMSLDELLHIAKGRVEAARAYVAALEVERTRAGAVAGPAAGGAA